MKAVDSIDALTGLRGLAAWWVVFYHFREALNPGNPLQPVFAGGYLAVDLFFVLSGFVLVLSYGGDFSDRIDGAGLKAFYLRRLARIYPLHLVVMLLFLLNPLAIQLFSTQKDLSERYDLSYYLQSLLLIQNWGFTASLRWNIPAWSISVEWFASLLFPFLVALFVRMDVARLGRAAVVVAGCAIVLVLLFRGHGYASIGDGIAPLGVYRCLFEFAMGLVAGMLFARRRAWCKRIAPWIIALGIGLIVIGFRMGLPDYVHVPTSFFLLVLGIAASSGALSRVLAAPWLVRLGEVSYSTYLVHYLCKDWVKFFSVQPDAVSFLLYCSLVLALSFALYWGVELPCKVGIYSALRRKREAF